MEKVKQKPLIPITGWSISIALHIALAAVFFIIRPMVVAEKGDDDSAAVQSSVPEKTVEKFIDLKVDSSAMASASLTPSDRITTGFKMGDGPMTPTVTSPGASAIAIPAKKPGSMSSFCGSAAKADRICYVIDCSGSMMIAFDYVKRQLEASLGQLAPYQYFNVILFSSGRPLQYPKDNLQRASKDQRANAIDFIINAKLTGSKNSTQQGQAFEDAIAKAFNVRTPGAMAPELIYLFTDGEFDHKQLKDAILKLKQKHPTPIAINIIACGSKENEPFLENLAFACNGNYTFVTDDQMAKPQEVLP